MGNGDGSGEREVVEVLQSWQQQPNGSFFFLKIAWVHFGVGPSHMKQAPSPKRKKNTQE
jgi:hypothetical protein